MYSAIIIYLACKDLIILVSKSEWVLLEISSLFLGNLLKLINFLQVYFVPIPNVVNFWDLKHLATRLLIN